MAFDAFTSIHTLRIWPICTPEPNPILGTKIRDGTSVPLWWCCGQSAQARGAGWGGGGGRMSGERRGPLIRLAI